MAAGEYVSVHSQADTEQADLALERTELKLDARASAGTIRQFASVAASILRSRKRSRINSWPMTRSARMRETNSGSLRHSVRVRYRRHLPQRASFAVGAGMPILTAAIASRGELNSPRVWNFTGVPRAVRRIGRARGWRTDGGRRPACYAVGRIGHGSDCRRRSTLWNSMSGANRNKSADTA